MIKVSKIIGLAAAALFCAGAAANGASTADAAELTRMTQFAEFGEPTYAEDFEHFDYVNVDAPKGGHIRVAVFGTFERINPIPPGPAWAQGLGHLYDTLMTGSGDDLGAYYPLIATAVHVPDDVSYAEFDLDPRARWHDGHPITADDFVFALDIIQEHARPLLQQFWRNLDSAEALGDHRLRINFATTNNFKTLGLAASLGPQPRHFYDENNLDPGVWNREPEVYEGAYEVEHVDIGRSITYRRVEDYWAQDLPVNRGLNNFERITYVYFRDLDVAFEAFRRGDIDFWSESEPRRWATGFDVPQVHDGRIALDDTIANNNPRGFAGLVMNSRRAPFDDLRVREALNLLYDYEWTRANILFGMTERARSYFPNSDYGIRDFPLPTDLELELLEPLRGRVPDDIFTEPFELNVTDGSGRIRNELREAWRLFEEAGWRIEDGQLRRTSDGQVMRFELITQVPQTVRAVQPFITNLSRAGIDASVRLVDSAQYRRIHQTYDFDMLAIGANFFPPPNEELWGYFGSQAAAEENAGNWPGIADPVVDELIEQIVSIDGQSEQHLERLKATTRVLDRVLMRGHYIVPTYYLARYRLAYWTHLQRPDTAPTYATGFPGSWWYDPAEMDQAAASAGPGR